MLWPFKEILEIFLYLDDEKHFTPMHEFQAYFFLGIMYPFVYFYSIIFSWFHMSITPVLMFWLIVDDAMLVTGLRENGSGIPRNNYARVYAEVDAVTGILYGDFNYLYKGKEAFSISFLEMLNHYMFAWAFFIMFPFTWQFMAVWLVISSFQLIILYIYIEVIKGEPSTEQ